MRKLAIKLIKFYQNHLPHRKMCKYSPTCSYYALEAFQRCNFMKALVLTIWRILRCNPWSKGGYDPVPKKLTKQSK